MRQEGTTTRQAETRGSQAGAGRGRTARRPRTYRTAVGLPEETRRAVVEMLNQTLADATDLMTQAKFAHWNVKGIHFYQLHLLFDEIAETLNEHIDIIAERATALGGEATGTVRMAAADSCIPEMPPDATTGPEYVEALVERVGIHANNLRADIEAAVEYDDEDTADLFTELSREVDKQLYFLEAHLQAVDPDAIPESPGASMQSQGSRGGNPSQYREGSHGRGHTQGGQQRAGPRQSGQQQPDQQQPGQQQFRQQSRGYSQLSQGYGQRQQWG